MPPVALSLLGHGAEWRRMESRRRTHSTPRDLNSPRRDRVRAAETLRKLHCKLRPGTPRAFNIGLFGIMNEISEERYEQALIKHILLCAPGNKGLFQEPDASPSPVTLRAQTALPQGPTSPTKHTKGAEGAFYFSSSLVPNGGPSCRQAQRHLNCPSVQL